MKTYITDKQFITQIYLIPWHYNGIITAMQEEKEKKRKKNENNFVFFSDEKNKIGNLKATEWVEIISSFKAPIYSANYSVRFKILDY